MAQYTIRGGVPLSGTVTAIGNKNAVLKMIPATLLTAEPVTLTNVPAISDVDVVLELMKRIGTSVSYDRAAGILRLHTPKIKTTSIDIAMAKQLRASNIFLGPLLARVGSVTGALPGGDKIGPREMNAHFDGFKQLGAKLRTRSRDSFRLTGPLRGSHIFLYEPSVTATENMILAAVLTPGKTIIENAACEPHVQELCSMLNQMGASISGIGTNRLEIIGVKKVRGTTYAVPPDFIYVGTMIVLSAITGGSIKVKNVVHEDMRSIIYFFGKLGVRIRQIGNDIIVEKSVLKVLDPTWARTKGFYSQPWPCFPSDMMSLAIVLATQVQGTTLFFEKMYPGRMFFADYLNGMGASIIIADPHRVIVNGRTVLQGRELYSPDLRAGMAYVAAGLAARGTTIVHTVEHIDRGYPDLAHTLQSLGADIIRED